MLLVLGIAPASARTTATTTPLPGSTVPVMVVLDASGSMNIADAPGPRITAAKNAVVGLVRELPAAAEVGLTVYGTATSSSPADKSAGCRDIRVFAPVRRLDRAALIAAVGSVRARGYTPIGAALQKAAAALPSGAPGSIVLVSDGQDTCAPPAPCAIAAQLKKANRDLVVHTIGFRVGGAARSELSCIASATGGTYRDAANGAGLGAQLRGQVDAGLRPYAVSGVPVNGTRTPDSAPLIAGGQYADTFPAGGPATKFYSIELAAPETVYVATTIIPPALRGSGTSGGGLATVTRLLDPTGRRCLSTERESTTLLAGKVDPVTALLSGVVGGADWSKRCATSGRFLVEVTRDTASATATRSETIVRLEPPVDPVPAPVSRIDAGLPLPAAASAPGSCPGGTSFTFAAPLPAGTCLDSLATGETRYYKVHLDWGQRLTYQVVVDRVATAQHGSGYVRSAVATPLRQLVALASDSNAGRYFGGPAAITVHGSTIVPVDYGNRNSTRSDIRSYGLAGDYYLSLGMSYPNDALPYRTGVRITARVVGAAQAGPHYLSLPKVTGSAVATSASTAAPTASSTPTPSATAPPTTGSGSWPWWLGGGAVVVLGAGAAGVLARRRRGAPR